jgi:hypothetical protein
VISFVCGSFYRMYLWRPFCQCTAGTIFSQQATGNAATVQAKGFVEDFGNCAKLLALGQGGGGFS